MFTPKLQLKLERHDTWKKFQKYLFVYCRETPYTIFSFGKNLSAKILHFFSSSKRRRGKKSPSLSFPAVLLSLGGFSLWTEKVVVAILEKVFVKVYLVPLALKPAAGLWTKSALVPFFFLFWRLPSPHFCPFSVFPKRRMRRDRVGTGEDILTRRWDPKIPLPSFHALLVWPFDKRHPPSSFLSSVCQNLVPTHFYIRPWD